MASYKKKVQTNPNVELIHISLDHDSEEALAWAQEASMPWPIIALEDMDVETLSKPYFEYDPEAPSYLLIDATGKEVARGKEAVFAKIKTVK